MLSDMTWEQFMGWMSYAATDPIGEERADARSALLAKILVDVNRAPNSEPAKIADFMLFTPRPEDEAANPEHEDGREAPLRGDRWRSVKDRFKSMFSRKQEPG